MMFSGRELLEPALMTDLYPLTMAAVEKDSTGGLPEAFPPAGSIQESVSR